MNNSIVFDVKIIRAEVLKVKLAIINWKIYSNLKIKSKPLTPCELENYHKKA